MRCPAGFKRHWFKGSPICLRCGMPNVWLSEEHKEMMRRKSREYAQNHAEYNRQKARDWYWANRERAIQATREYQRKNPAKVKEWRQNGKETMKKWLESHRAQVKRKAKEWKEAHKDQVAKKTHEWYERNRDRKMATATAWYQTHREYVRERNKNHRHLHPELNRKNAKLQKARRHRNYPTTTIIGFPLKGFALHHISPDTAVYVPEGLHRSIKHSLKSGKGMDRINFRAHEWIL